MPSKREAPLSRERGVSFSARYWNAVEYFVKEEFRCPCCHANRISKRLVTMLDRARKIAGVPMIVNSGYRCPDHNRAVGGSPTSSHLDGLAADISTPDHQTRYRIARALLLAGFRRVIIYRDKGFIHVDVDPDKPQDILPIV